MGAGDFAFWTDVAYLIQPPAVRLVQQAAQTITSNAVQFVTYGVGSEERDTHGWHSETVNPTRYTPQVAGMYAVEVTANIICATTTTWIRSAVAKNGSVLAPIGQERPAAAAISSTVITVATVEMNGSTDYIEHYINQLDSGAVSRLTSVAAGLQSVMEIRRVGAV